MQRLQLQPQSPHLPGLSKPSKAQSFSNIVRAINDIANYSQYKRKLLAKFPDDLATSPHKSLNPNPNPSLTPTTSRHIKLTQITSQPSKESVGSKRGAGGGVAAMAMIELKMPESVRRRKTSRLGDYETMREGGSNNSKQALVTLLERTYEKRKDPEVFIHRRHTNINSHRAVAAHLFPSASQFKTVEDSTRHSQNQKRDRRFSHNRRRKTVISSQSMKPVNLNWEENSRNNTPPMMMSPKKGEGDNIVPWLTVAEQEMGMFG